MRRFRLALLFAAGAVLVQSCGSTTDTEPHPGSTAGTGGRGQAGAGAGASAGGSAGRATGGTPSGASAGQGGQSEPGAAAGAGGEGGAASHSAFAWQLSYGQSYAAHVAADSSGAAIVSGTLFDTADVTLGGTTVKSHGAADVMLSRVLASGQLDWAKAYGGTGDDYPVSFVLDNADRILMTGLYNGTGNLGGADFPPFAGTAGRLDVSVAELGPSGVPMWSVTMNSNAEAFAGPGLAVDAAGHLFVPGSFLGTTTIGGAAHTSLGSWDGFLARYDVPSGTFGGALPFGGTAEDRASAVLLTSTDRVLVGKFSGSVAFPTTPTTLLTSVGGSDVFLARVSAAGAMTSVVSFGGVNNEEVTGAHLDSQGRVVLVGTFSSPTLSVLGGPTLHSAGGADLFVARLSPTLGHEWSVSFGGDADDYVRDLAILPNDDLAITGEFRDHLTLGDRGWDAVPSAASGPTDIDFFVATLDSTGNPIWSYAAGGPGQERGLGIAADSAGGLYVTASLTSSIDFGGGTVLTAAAGQFSSALVRYEP